MKAPVLAKAGVSPRAGLVSCAGMFEGRCAASNGMPYAMTFRNGKVSISAPMMGEEESESWIGDGKLVLTKAGKEGAIEIDINDDGTIQTPFGEMKKKGN